MSDDGLGRDRWIRGLRREFADQPIGVSRDVVRRLDHQPLQRPAIGRDPLLQALLHPLHDHGVLFHTCDRVGAFARRQFGNQLQTGVTFFVEIDYPYGVGEERIEPRDVVAHVIHQLRITR